MDLRDIAFATDRILELYRIPGLFWKGICPQGPEGVRSNATPLILF